MIPFVAELRSFVTGYGNDEDITGGEMNGIARGQRERRHCVGVMPTICLNWTIMYSGCS